MNFKNPKKGKQKIGIVNQKQRRQIAVLASKLPIINYLFKFYHFFKINKDGFNFRKKLILI